MWMIDWPCAASWWARPETAMAWNGSSCAIIPAI
jgi:hypothetical protein